MKNQKKAGKVYLVGAGPGDPDLITLKGYKLLKICDVVVYDALASKVLLDYAVHATKLSVGKYGHLPKKSISQSEINKILIREAKKGKIIVRLKGGEPLVFGRGSEEATALKKGGVAFEIVPGVTAAFAAASYGGVPLTDRRHASSVTFATGHLAGERSKKLYWKKLAQLGGTLVIYMGMQKILEIQKALIRGGLNRLTPVAIVENASLPSQRVCFSNLKGLGDLARPEKVKTPGIIIIGDAVKRKEDLDWYSLLPLAGKRILVTRATEQVGVFREKLHTLGAEVLELPVIEIKPCAWKKDMKAGLHSLNKWEWIIFTSANGVNFFFSKMRSEGLDARILGGLKVAVVGRKSREALLAYGVNPDLVPKDYSSRALIAKFQKFPLSKKRMLWIRGNLAPEALAVQLRQRGAIVDGWIVYNTCKASRVDAKMLSQIRSGNFEYGLFTSSSTVRNFISIIGKKSFTRICEKVKWLSIGPSTLTEMEKYSIPALSLPKEATIDGMVDRILADIKNELS